ncbi:MAG: NADH-quinone oxidoreductase subunit J [Gammaproteobacteria bacterium]|nr:NADH-quinone oxidoreductase subunit J [Gammaproteobacteria bacterium]
MFTQILFYLFATVLVGAAIGVITARNPVHSVLFLVLAFFNSAVLWLLLGAEFLAIVLVLVYVGAVMVLFLFVVMMLDINVEQAKSGFTKYAPLGLVVLVIMAVELAQVIWVRHMGMISADELAPVAADYNNTRELGLLLYTDYFYAFELAAVILLVAIVAAISLTMRRRPGLKAQNISSQVSVRRQDRVRLVKMDSEERQ